MFNIILTHAQYLITTTSNNDEYCEVIIIRVFLDKTTEGVLNVPVRGIQKLMDYKDKKKRDSN